MNNINLIEMLNENNKTPKHGGGGSNLFDAISMDDLGAVEGILKVDPSQINDRWSEAKIPALSFAVWHGNPEIVAALAAHSLCAPLAVDVFGRSALDMLAYTTNDEIVDCVLAAAYPDANHYLEEQRRRAHLSVVPKPKP